MSGISAAGPDNRLAEPLGVHLERWLQPTPTPTPAPRPTSTSRPASWRQIVQAWRREDPAAASLIAAIEARQAQGACVYPAQVLRALDLTPLDRVRVIIVGQDPYHGPGQAQGLAFSVAAGHRLPPSLRNILQEIRRDLGGVSPQAERGDLSAWAEQGVLLLNTCLTVEDGQAGAHARLGWESLTDRLIAAAAQQAADQGRPLVAMLWGLPAQKRRAALGRGGAEDPLLRVLQCNHPSPLSARRPPVPFLGCGHFSQAREFLASAGTGEPPIVW